MRRQTAFAFILAFAVIAAGLGFTANAGAPPALVMAQGAVGLVALVIGALVERLAPDPGSRGAVIAVVVALMSLAATFFDPGLEGVHRWISLGPVAIQPAAIALPIIVWFAASRPEGWLGAAVMIAGAVLCAAQPDSQASGALVAATGVLVLLAPRRLTWLVALGIGVIGWIVSTSAPPLAPVAYVEGVLRAAWSAGPLLGLLVVLALVAVPATFLIVGRGRQDRLGGAMMALWLVFCSYSLTGLYPTPVIGFGLSWVLGFGISLGLVAGARSETT